MTEPISSLAAASVQPQVDKPEVEHAENVVHDFTVLTPHDAKVAVQPPEPTPTANVDNENVVAEEVAAKTELPKTDIEKEETQSRVKTGLEEGFVIPKTCKAGCVVNPGPDFTVQVEEVSVPEPGPDEILLKLNATGICYSDLHYMLEDLALPKMSAFGVRSPGHEGAGVVVKIGSNVKNWKVGDRGGVKPMWDTCMNCELCWDGFHETYCSNTVSTGLMQTGTYQQYITSPARYTTRIPDGVDDFTAGPIMCSGSTIYRSLVESELKAGDWAVFPGAGGGVGHMGVQLAKAMGMRVIGIDGGEEKRALCERLGCEAFVDFTKIENVEEEVIKITDGKGAHGIFVTATSPAAYASAPKMVRVGGRVMCIGLTPAGTATVGADPGWFIFKNLHVIGTMVGSMRDTDAALNFAARGLLKPIYEKYPIARLPEAVDKLRKGKVAGRGVIDFNS